MKFSEPDTRSRVKQIYLEHRENIDLSQLDKNLYELQSKTINNANFAYLYHLFSRVSIIPYEKEKVKIIDQYMRMFFNAVIFTDMIEGHYSLATPAEQKIIEWKLHNKNPTDKTAEADKENFEHEHATLTINNYDEISALYKKDLQAKKSFYDINYIGQISIRNNNYTLCLNLDDLIYDSIDDKAKLLKFCLSLISLSLYKKSA